MRPCLIVICFLVSSCAIAQKEQVYLQFDKYNCWTGDTIYFKGYIFQNSRPTKLSTNLYTDLWTETGVLLVRKVFPVMGGVSIGQLRIPDSLPSGNYYVRAFSAQQLNFDTSKLFLVPIAIYNKDRPRQVLNKKISPNCNLFSSDYFNHLTWLTTVFKDSLLSSMVSIDSGGERRNFIILKADKPGFSYITNVSLSPKLLQKYSLFPRDMHRETETLFLYEDSVLIGEQHLLLKQPKDSISVSLDTLDTAPYGINSWTINFPDSMIYTSSVSITDAGRVNSPPLNILSLQDSRTDNFTTPIKKIDTSYICLSGKVTKQYSNKLVKDPFSKEIMIAGGRDSSYVFYNVVKQDSAGGFKLDSLFFFGTISLEYRLNQRDGQGTNIHLNFYRGYMPRLDTNYVQEEWADDSTTKLDTVYTTQEKSSYDLSKVKVLRPVVVKGWKNPRNELDNKYTSGPFSEPALFVYDLRNYQGDYNRDVGSFLNGQMGRVRYDPVNDTFSDVFKHPINFFLDEMPVDWFVVRGVDFDRIAYIKVLESDFLKMGGNDLEKTKMVSAGNGPLKLAENLTPINVCIYQRKGTDFRTMRGGMNKAIVRGYDDILKFGSDRLTLYWNPTVYGRTFNVRFINNDHTRRFRMVVEGVSYLGNVVRFEKVIE